MQIPFKTVAIGALTLDLYTPPKPTFPAPWMPVDQVLACAGLDPAGEMDFVNRFGGPTTQWVARVDRQDGSALYLVPAAVAIDALNQATSGLDPDMRAAIEAAFAIRTVETAAAA